MTWLRIHGSPEMGFYDREAERIAGGLTDNAWRRLASMDAFRRAMGPGAEPPSVTVALDNGDGELTALLLEDPPLKARASVGEGDTVIATGAVTRVAGGPVISIQLEGDL